MPNTKSAKKALRQSIKKRRHNLYWKRQIRAVVKSIKHNLKNAPQNTDILKKDEAKLQKILDKAAKNKVIHKNKANRLKSRIAKRISAYEEKPTKKPKSTKTAS